MTHISVKRIFFVLLSVFVLSALIWLALIRNVITPPQQPFITEVVIGANDAQLSEKWSHEEELNIRDEGKFHLVTNVILVTHKHYSANLQYDSSRVPTTNQLDDRQHEIETSLQNNLNHDRVAAIHVLYFHPAVSMYLLKLRLTNSSKLVLHLTKRDPSVGVNLDYIQKYLKNKIVILMHQDNFLGEGWEKVDFTLLRTQRLMYALTRHSVTEEFPCNAAIGASCNPGKMYLGSHDTFVFYSDRKFEKAMLKELDIVPSSGGMENVLIWYFKEKLGYHVLNPCKVLIVYHNHCIPIREKGRKRYNRKGKNGLAPFTDKLYDGILA